MELVGMLVLLLAVGALIIWPLLRHRPPEMRSVERTPAADPARSRAALTAIKELEFDYATGKIADDDYRTLRARYEAKAVEALATPAPSPAPADSDAALEAEIRAARGRRFCTTCGGALPKAAKFCPACGAAVEVAV